MLSSLCQLFVSTFLFSAELLEAKGTGNEQLSQTHHFKLSFVSNNKVYKKTIVDYYTHVC